MWMRPDLMKTARLKRASVVGLCIEVLAGPLPGKDCDRSCLATRFKRRRVGCRTDFDALGDPLQNRRESKEVEGDVEVPDGAGDARSTAPREIAVEIRFGLRD